MRSYDEYIQKNPEEVSIFDFARNGDIKSLNAVLEQNHSLDINLKDHKGYSALMYAAYNGHTDLVLSLIAQGADLESTDKGGSTILMGVAFKGHADIAQILIEAGANIHATNFVGMNALQFAQMFGRTEVVTLLNSEEQSAFQRFTQQIKTWGYYFSQKMNSKKESRV